MSGTGAVTLASREAASRLPDSAPANAARRPGGSVRCRRSGQTASCRLMPEHPAVPPHPHPSCPGLVQARVRGQRGRSKGPQSIRKSGCCLAQRMHRATFAMAVPAGAEGDGPQGLRPFPGVWYGPGLLSSVSPQAKAKDMRRQPATCPMRLFRPQRATGGPRSPAPVCLALPFCPGQSLSIISGTRVNRSPTRP